MKQRVQDLIQQGDALFTKRSSMLSLWQETAENFYPERADFTVQRQLGEEFAEGLMTGSPSMMRRDLANSLSAMLRPRGQNWFGIGAERERINEDTTAKAWMEWAAGVQRRAMYDRPAMFVRATKEGDHDFATFGQTVLTGEMNVALDGLIYRCWHLRDVAWAENGECAVDTVHHRWKPTVATLARMFPGKLDAKVMACLDKEPLKEIQCRRIILPADQYDLGKNADRFPFVSIYVDQENETVLEETPVTRSPFIIPRWQTVSGSQYAHSPATVIALPDARLLQQITLTLLEAGQKAVDPPMVATQEIVRGDMNLYAGGVTWVDAEYDERLGEALRPITLDRSGLQYGANVAAGVSEMIARAFYLNQITLPPATKDMTAYETRARIEEYIRAALPLFEPMESEYNGALCEHTFGLLLEHGAFGSVEDMPPALRGQQIRFTFESPLQATAERVKAQAFQESAQLLAVAAQLDPNAGAEIDVRTAFRDALGSVAPAKWIVPVEVSDQTRAANAQQQQIQQLAQTVGMGAEVAKTVGEAGQALQGVAA